RRRRRRLRGPDALARDAPGADDDRGGSGRGRAERPAAPGDADRSSTWARVAAGVASGLGKQERSEAPRPAVAQVRAATPPATAPRPRPTAPGTGTVAQPRRPFHSSAGDSANGRALRRGLHRSVRLTRTPRGPASDSSVA